MPAPRLIPVTEPKNAEAAVLVLHGGASRGESVMVSPAQLSVIRMIPIARRVVLAGRRRLTVYRLLNSSRGWDTSHTPVDDARWALGEIRERVGDLPVGLVGHSLGGRAALLAGGEPAVRSVVALAPWTYATDSADLAGRRVLIVHGSADRIASPQRSLAVATALRRRTDVGYICIDGGKHAMLSHHHQYDGFAASFTAAALLGDDAVRAPDAVRRVLAGERDVTV